MLQLRHAAVGDGRLLLERRALVLQLPQPFFRRAQFVTEQQQLRSRIRLRDVRCLMTRARFVERLSCSIDQRLDLFTARLRAPQDRP